MRKARVLLGGLLATAVALGAACNDLVGLPDDLGGFDASLADASAPIDAAAPEASSRDGGPTPDADVRVAPAPDAADAATDAGGDTAPPEAGEAGEVDAMAVCDGGVVDLTTSSTNCGACGHDCIARCSAGLCEVAGITGSFMEERGLWALFGLTFFDGALFGTDWYRTYCGVYGVGPYVSVTEPSAWATFSAPVSAYAITHDTTQLYFSILKWDAVRVLDAPPGIYSLSESDGTRALLYGIEGVDRLAADGSYLYFSDHTGHVYSSGKDGKNVQAFSSGSTADSSFVPAGGVVYFVADGVLVRATPPNLGAFAAVSDVGHADVFDVDASNAYWFDGTTHTLHARSVSLNGPSSDITPAGGFAPSNPASALLVDSANPANLYVVSTTTQAAQIHRLKSDGSAPPQLLVDSHDGIFAATQNDGTIFYTTYGSGNSTPPYAAVWRVQKPAP